MNTLDLVALHHMPNDMPRGYAPLQIEGDGNCFPRTISYLLYKTQDRYEEMRCRIVYEAVKNINHYLDHDYVSNGAHTFMTEAHYQSNMHNIRIITTHTKPQFDQVVQEGSTRYLL